jgi:purine-binding chemotaxis protein CheW
MDSSDAMERTQYLTFTLRDEVFALEISRVLEVLDYTAVTRVPRMPEFMLGVINLRGRVVPVADLRLRFEMAKTEKTVNTCIIITEVLVGSESRILGVVVDAVKEVVDISPADVEPAPKFGTRLDTAFIKGMGKHNGLIIFLDLDRVFSDNETVGAPDSTEEPRTEPVSALPA